MDGPEDDESNFKTPQKRAHVDDDHPPDDSVLRSQIAKVFADSTLTPSEKFSRVNALRGMMSSAVSSPVGVSKDDVDADDDLPECPHYVKQCLLECNVCKKFVQCRLCHEEMDRFKVAHLKCVRCGHVQVPDTKCFSCHQPFAAYCCTVCHTYDSAPGKKIFHCSQCGICRLGTRETTRHCDKCNMCIVLVQKKSNDDDDANDDANDGQSDAERFQHSCFENSFRQDCGACLQRLWDSREQVSVLRCGHAMHAQCLQRLLASDYRCPLCKRSVAETAEEDWADVDEAMEQQMEQMRTSLPPEWLNKDVQCMCNECHTKFTSKFNPFVMYKCTSCGTYNTQLI